MIHAAEAFSKVVVYSAETPLACNRGGLSEARHSPLHSCYRHRDEALSTQNAATVYSFVGPRVSTTSLADKAL